MSHAPAATERPPARPALSSRESAVIRDAARRHGMEAPRVFGSRVRGQSQSGGDLDLLVRLGHGRGWGDLLAFCDEVESALDERLDVVLEDGLSPFLRDRVLAEAVPI